MPQYDLYHQPVKRALNKDGWLITDDPYVITYKGLRLYADLGAEKPLAAQKLDREIVVEVKSFGAPSLVFELERALGQYSIYRTLLERISPARELWLAVAQDIYEDFFQQPAILDIVAAHQMRLLVFEPTREEIILWIG